MPTRNRRCAGVAIETPSARATSVLTGDLWQWPSPRNWGCCPRLAAVDAVDDALYAVDAVEVHGELHVGRR